MVSIPVPRSENLIGAVRSFLSEIGAWVEACISDYSNAPPIDSHDQCTYTTAWEPYIRAADDSSAIAFMKKMRDGVCSHFVSRNVWRHGYWRTQEAHHGTEHFQLFLGTLWRLDPNDGETVRQMIDAAEHFGNWEPSVPPWFDWTTGLYRSFYFGTDGVRDGVCANVPDHFRCVNIALIAYEMTRDARYLDLAAAHGSLWAEALTAGQGIPVALSPEGPVFGLADPEMRAYLSSVGELPELGSDVDRAENLLASGAVDALLRLWALTGRQLLRESVEALMKSIVSQLPDPDAGPACAAVRTYRDRTGDHRYDSAVLDAASQLRPRSFSELGLEPWVKRERRPVGIGKRRDMPIWYEDGAPRRSGPVLLALSAEISGDEELAVWAVDVARAYFSLARKVYPHGREHGCSAATVSAIARGHGRDNNTGVVTSVLAPLLNRAGSV